MARGVRDFNILLEVGVFTPLSDTSPDHRERVFN